MWGRMRKVVSAIILISGIFSTVATAHAVVSCDDASESAAQNAAYISGMREMQANITARELNSGARRMGQPPSDQETKASAQLKTREDEIPNLFREACHSGDVISVPSAYDSIVRRLCNFDKSVIQNRKSTTCVMK